MAKILNALERGVNKFFEGLKKNAADSVVKMAEKQELSPEAKKAMKEMDEMYDDFRDLLNNI